MKFSSSKFQDRFVGTVKNAKIEEDTKYGSKKLVLRILSRSGTERDLKYKVTEAPLGKMAMLVNALKELGIDEFEEKDLIGKTFVWERREMNFADKEGTEVNSFLYVPIEIENGEKQKSTPKPSVQEKQPEPAKTEPQKTEPEKQPEQVKTEVTQSEEEKDIDWSELDTKLKDGMTNSAIKRIGTKIGATRQEIDEHMEALDTSGKLKQEGDEYFINN